MTWAPPAVRPSADWVADLDSAGDIPPNCTPTQIANAITVATRLLYKASGRQFDTPISTVRPCSGSWLRQFLPPAAIASLLPPIGPGFASLSAFSNSGLLFSWLATCDCEVDACTCQFVSRVMLKPYPVIAVTNVSIDGVAHPTLDGGNSGDIWRLVNFRWLMRTDDQLWPSCQDLRLDDTQVGTWSVTFQHGKPVPPEASMACGELALELLKASKGLPCGLNRRVTQVARQGVTMQLLDPILMLEKGKTGLYFVDLFLQFCNPAKLQRAGRVYRADDTNRQVRDPGDT